MLARTLCLVNHHPEITEILMMGGLSSPADKKCDSAEVSFDHRPEFWLFSGMNCPRCIQRIHRGAESCPHCGFSIANTDLLFSEEHLPRFPLEDTAGILRRSDLQRIQVAQDRFSSVFPQLFFAIYIRSFRAHVDLRQYGFWALNRGTFRERDTSLKNSAGVLLVMDVECKKASLTFGYLLDSYLDESDTQSCLAKAQLPWLNHSYTDGIILLIKHLEGILIRKHRILKRNPDVFIKKTSAPDRVAAIAKRIRDKTQKE